MKFVNKQTNIVAMWFEGSDRYAPVKDEWLKDLRARGDSGPVMLNTLEMLLGNWFYDRLVKLNESDPIMVGLININLIHFRSIAKSWLTDEELEQAKNELEECEDEDEE